MPVFAIPCLDTGGDCIPPETIQNPLILAIGNTITVILVIVAIIASIFLILGITKWIFVGKDKTKTKVAKKTIINAIIALVLAVLIWWVISIAVNIFGSYNSKYF